MKLVHRIFLLVIIFFFAGTQLVFSQINRTSGRNYIAVLATSFGYGLNYNYQISKSFAGEFQYFSASSGGYDNKLTTGSFVLSGKYFPFASQNLYLNLAYLGNDWNLTVSDAYKNTATKYEMTRKWSSGFAFGAGFGLYGSSTSFFSGTMGIMAGTAEAKKFKFQNTGGGSKTQQDEAVSKYESAYAHITNFYYVYASIGIRF